MDPEHLEKMKREMISTLNEVREKSSSLTAQELETLLCRCAATLVSINNVRAITHSRDYTNNKQRLTTTFCII